MVGRFTTGKTSQLVNDIDLTTGALHEDIDRGLPSHREKEVKFENFEDQLKQIRLSRQFLENNPQIEQQVIISEAKKESAKANREREVFQIDDNVEESKELKLMRLEVKGDRTQAATSGIEEESGFKMIDTTGST